MFTKQHHKAIAKVLSDIVPKSTGELGFKAIVIDRLSDMFEADNDRFKRSMFVIKCNEGK